MITLELFFRDCLDKVGTAFLGALECLLIAPLLNLGVVAAEEHFGHSPATELGRAGVFGRSKKAVLKRVAQS